VQTVCDGDPNREYIRSIIEDARKALEEFKQAFAEEYPTLTEEEKSILSQKIRKDINDMKHRTSEDYRPPTLEKDDIE
jgi:vacuolar-type H+-ATPase subunit H